MRTFDEIKCIDDNLCSFNINFVIFVSNIESNIKEEIQTIRKKFTKADYARRFANSVINQSNNKTKEK